MSKKNIFLVALVVVLAGLYVVYFTDWFRPKFIRIEHTVRSVSAGGRELNNVTFSLHKDYRLTSLKVVSSAEYQTNDHTAALWHLVAEKGSTPVKGFAYGFAIPGMTPFVAGTEPYPLKSGVNYRLLLEARSVKGEHEFAIVTRTISRK
jgi:hypothetical protein